MILILPHPCKNCITYSICNACLSNINPPFEYFNVREQLLSIYKHDLQDRCKLIKDYVIHHWVKIGDVSINKVIIKTIEEGFNVTLDPMLKLYHPRNMSVTVSEIH